MLAISYEIFILLTPTIFYVENHNIEKFNKTDDYCQPIGNQSEVNQSTLPELLQAADLAIETQTLHLPRRAAQLINN